MYVIARTFLFEMVDDITFVFPQTKKYEKHTFGHCEFTYASSPYTTMHVIFKLQKLSSGDLAYIFYRTATFNT